MSVTIPPEVTANVNSTQCLKTMTHAGYEVVTNVCSGKVTTVQWGLFDWAADILLVLGGLALVLILVGVVYWIFSAARENW